MPSLDQATMERIAARQGVPLTPENMNRISDFAAANPDILERYSMGTAPAQVQRGPSGRYDVRGGPGGGVDDNAALLRMIDNQINQPTIERRSSTQTYEPAPAPAPKAIPRGRVEVGQPQKTLPPGL